jgi:hypothetical protein
MCQREGCHNASAAAQDAGKVLAFTPPPREPMP